MTSQEEFSAQDHLYGLFPLYLCQDMCEISFQCEMISSLSLPLILLLPLSLEFLASWAGELQSILLLWKFPILGALSQRTVVGHRCESWEFRGVLRIPLFYLAVSRKQSMRLLSKFQSFRSQYKCHLLKIYAFFYLWVKGKSKRKRGRARTPFVTYIEKIES